MSFIVKNHLPHFINTDKVMQMLDAEAGTVRQKAISVHNILFEKFGINSTVNWQTGRIDIKEKGGAQARTVVSFIPKRLTIKHLGG